MLTPANSHLIYLLQNKESLLESLDQIVSLYQKESEAKVQKLRMLQIASGVAILLTLIFLGLYIFRPLANTLLKERFQLETANQELSFLSSVDGLTGIANRRHFDQFLEQLWLLAARNGEQISVIMCDIDYFKAYNRVAIGQAKPGDLPKSLIEAADNALYQAKQGGRNRFKLANILGR